MWTPLSATPEHADAPAPLEPELDLSARIARAETIARPGLRVSRNAVLAVVTVFAVIGIVAGFLDNYLTAHVAAPTVHSAPAPAASVPTTHTAAPTRRGLPGLLGLSPGHGTATGFRLVDQQGHPVDLADLRGKVVVLSFFDPNCRDICPVVAAELRAAARDLGPAASSVAFVTVDTDPLHTGPAAAVEGARTSGLGGPGGIPGWRYLSGTLAQLDAVWEHYGITVDVQRATRAVSHNDTLWFIDPSGHLAYEATPFADQNRRSGAFTLAAATERRFGAGIARYARHLLPAPAASGAG